MLRFILRRFFASKFYPTQSTNWYKDHNYLGLNLKEQFADFLSKQSQKGAIYFKEFQSLNLKRQFILSGQHILDSVLIKPKIKGEFNSATRQIGRKN